MAEHLSILQAILLGVVQGMTEWLPVSSSGHLVIAQELLGVEAPVFFDLFLHVATLMVILVYYRTTIIDILRALVGSPGAVRTGGWFTLWSDPQRRLAWLVVIGSIPTAFVGFFLQDQIVSLFDSPHAVGVALLATGTFLWLTRYARPIGVGMKPWHALLIGAAQGIAILPGISRSGSTIGAATLLGIDRESAAKFSFLLYVPAVGGSLILQTTAEAVAEVQANLLAYCAGFVAAVLVGYATLVFLVMLIRQQRFHWFAPYCLTLGAGFLVWLGLA